MTIPNTLARPVLVASLVAVLASALAMSQAPTAAHAQIAGGERPQVTTARHVLGAVDTALVAAAPAASVHASSVLSVSAVRYCTSAVYWGNASRWAAPHGCYAAIHYPQRASYPVRPSWGWCNWAAEESHLQFQGYGALHQAKHFGAPRVGAVVWFNPYVQGAGHSGHWATLVAIGPNGWGLIEEENFYWRGGGFGRIDYRFIRLYQTGTAYLY